VTEGACDFCDEPGPTVFVAPSLPGGGHRYCRPCLARRDALLGVQEAS
jgi:hypothetical protein